VSILHCKTYHYANPRLFKKNQQWGAKLNGFNIAFFIPDTNKTTTKEVHLISTTFLKKINIVFAHILKIILKQFKVRQIGAGNINNKYLCILSSGMLNINTGDRLLDRRIMIINLFFLFPVVFLMFSPSSL